MTATPRPWAHDEMTEELAVFRIHGSNGRRVADVDCATTFMEDVDEAEANARLIVRAVNMHDEMAAALKGAVELIEMVDWFAFSLDMRAKYDAAKEAIRKAEEGK